MKRAAVILSLTVCIPFSTPQAGAADDARDVYVVVPAIAATPIQTHRAVRQSGDQLGMKVDALPSPADLEEGVYAAITDALVAAGIDRSNVVRLRMSGGALFGVDSTKDDREAIDTLKRALQQIQVDSERRVYAVIVAPARRREPLAALQHQLRCPNGCMTAENVVELIEATTGGMGAYVGSSGRAPNRLLDRSEPAAFIDLRLVVVDMRAAGILHDERTHWAQALNETDDDSVARMLQKGVLALTRTTTAQIMSQRGWQAARPVSPARRQTVALFRIDPKYPPDALHQRVNGAVTARLEIDPGGAVSKVSIIKATPPDVFDEAAIDALRKWRFVPEHESYTAEVDVKFDWTTAPRVPLPLGSGPIAPMGGGRR